MWQHADSILADFLERGDVVNVGGTIAHVHSIGLGSDNDHVIIYGVDDEWQEEFEYTVPSDFYVPVMVYID